ncbi:MAG: 5-aminolevulic acid synthase [Pseudorhodobacter sp.]
MHNNIIGLGLAAAAVLVLPGLGFAEPVSGKDALKQVFSPKGAEVEMLPLDGLSAENAALLQQVAQDYAYYAAVAIAPEEELLKSEATVLVANHHSVEAATQAALAGCNKARTSAKECAIVAVVRPKEWAPRDLQLSIEATIALEKDYGKSGERAMATSAETGFFALAKGAGAQDAAVKACTDKGAKDCVVVVADAE